MKISFETQVVATYFEEPGEENTQRTLELAKRRAEELGIETILVASTRGETGVRACEVFQGYDVVVVTHSTGFKEPDFQELTDENRQEVPDGTVGEIAVGGPTVFAGYLNLPEATGEAVDDEGWLYTGDLATRDSDGYYRIVGRTSEMYIRGGENVYPREVEEVICEHPDVLLAAVLGIPDSVMGESGRAYILKLPASELSEDDVRAYCAERLAGFKVPKEVVFRETLPLTPVGKVLKKELAEEIGQEFG